MSFFVTRLVTAIQTKKIDLVVQQMAHMREQHAFEQKELGFAEAKDDGIDAIDPKTGMPPLICAITTQQIDITQWLLTEAKASTDTKDASGYTALWHAANLGRLDNCEH